MDKTRKKDRFYDTKAGRMVLLVLAVALLVLGGVLIVLYFLSSWWYLLVMGVVSVFSGVCNLIVLDRKRKECAFKENPGSEESKDD